MIKKLLHIYFPVIVFILTCKAAGAQQPFPDNQDTFFLAKKKGILGKVGKSLSRTPHEDAPVKVENPFLEYRGMIIRNIETIRLGFEYDIDDTTRIKDNFGITVGKIFHSNTDDNVIRNNLFFKPGYPVYPYLMADNERYLRDLVYIKDARIMIEPISGSSDSVDVIVLTKDVFSIGGRLSISSTERARVEIREENFLGTGNRLQLSSYYEKIRDPKFGVGGEFIRRNIAGTFIDWVSGYQDYRYAFSSERNQETVVYTRFEKPLVTPYIPTTGALEWSYQRTRNVYDTDSLYRADFRYAYYNIDGWFGYSLDNSRSLYSNREVRVHRFIALRAFKQHFIQMPEKYKTTFDYRFTDLTGTLASLNFFRQSFYKTTFIYGFGRKEDIPEGFNASVTAGFVSKQNIRRPYSGVDLTLGGFRRKGFYSNYTLRIGGFYYKKRFEDIDLLFDVFHFTRLRKVKGSWYHRLFLNSGITAQANPVLNTPLFIRSIYGLPYFSNGTLASDLRATIKVETVFYNTTKVLGFRFAPFAFTDFILVKPVKQQLSKSDIFTAIGGGVRTRNENLVFGTIELKTFYFPRTNGNMRPWKIEVSSNIRFRYRSTFISRPDFIMAN